MGKGSNFEREISKILSKWFTYGKRDDVIWRTHSSGARASIRKKHGKTTKYQFGDLTFSDEIAQPLFDIWNIECKTGYSSKQKRKENKKIRVTNWCVLDVLDSNQAVPIIIGMWLQCSDNAMDSNRIPILIFRRLFMTTCIAMPQRYFQSLTRVFKTYNQPYVILNYYEEKINIFNLFDWLAWAEPQILLKTQFNGGIK